MRSFTCGLCQKTFLTERPAEEVQAEYEQNFGAEAGSDKASLCDDCYERVVTAYPPAEAVRDRELGWAPDPLTQQRIDEVSRQFGILESAGYLPTIHDLLRRIPWGTTSGLRPRTKPQPPEETPE